MNAFKSACKVEDKAMRLLGPFLKHVSNGKFVSTTKGRLSRDLQKVYGDFVLEHNRDVLCVEVKSEETDKHGNFFLETWSNKSRNTPGWMYHLRSDILLYIFVDTGKCYSMSLSKLKRWLFEDDRYKHFPERPQQKRDQLNDTWGRCVPILTVKNQVGYREYNLGIPEPA